MSNVSDIKSRSERLIGKLQSHVKTLDGTVRWIAKETGEREEPDTDAYIFLWCAIFESGLLETDRSKKRSEEMGNIAEMMFEQGQECIRELVASGNNKIAEQALANSGICNRFMLDELLECDSRIDLIKRNAAVTEEIKEMIRRE